MPQLIPQVHRMRRSCPRRQRYMWCSVGFVRPPRWRHCRKRGVTNHRVLADQFA